MRAQRERIAGEGIAGEVIRWRMICGRHRSELAYTADAAEHPHFRAYIASRLREIRAELRARPA